MLHELGVHQLHDFVDVASFQRLVCANGIQGFGGNSFDKGIGRFVIGPGNRQAQGKADGQKKSEEKFHHVRIVGLFVILLPGRGNPVGCHHIGCLLRVPQIIDHGRVAIVDVIHALLQIGIAGKGVGVK